MRSRRAFTLVELLVVLATVALLAALLLPAVQAAREFARRSQCSSNMRQFGIGIANYEDQFGKLPASVGGFSIHVSLLPTCEQQALYDKFNFDIWATEPVNMQLTAHEVSIFHCPSEALDEVTLTNYGANKGTGYWNGGDNDGFFVFVDTEQTFFNSASITDGLTHTVAMSELSTNQGGRIKEGQPEAGSRNEVVRNCFAAGPSQQYMGVPWVLGGLSCTSYNHILTPNTCSCTNGTNHRTGVFSSSSWHVDGVNVLFADGRVELVRDEVHERIWLSYGSRSGAERISNY